MDRKHNSSINNDKLLVPARTAQSSTLQKSRVSQATSVSEEEKTTAISFGETEQQGSSDRLTGSNNSVVKQQAIEFQIKKNQEIANKLSPITKYKVQEFLRKKRSRCPQRRKFSIRHGALQRRMHVNLQSQQSRLSQEMPFPPIVSFTPQPNLNHFMMSGDIDLD